MKRKTVTTVAALATAILWSGMALADGHKTPNGKHYNLNIIGVENPKNDQADMTGSNRHTIFVPLNTTGKGIKAVKYEDQDGDIVKVAGAEIETQIWLMPGETFKVCDGNGFDEARGCDDEALDEWNTCAYVDGVYECGDISRKDGAVFQLPCNQNVSAVGDETLLACETGDGSAPVADYSVYARPLGKPGGESVMTTCADVLNEDTGFFELQCSLDSSVQTRERGQSVWNDVTQDLTSMVIDLCVDWDDEGNCLETDSTRISLFAGDTEEWFWNYANDGLRLLQLRFYQND